MAPGFTFAASADASVVCGSVDRIRALDGFEAVTNPRAVVEVLSPSTEAYDRGDKFDHYVVTPF